MQYKIKIDQEAVTVSHIVQEAHTPHTNVEFLKAKYLLKFRRIQVYMEYNFCN